MTNASRTQLLNLRALDWDDEILALFGIPRALLPEVQASGSLFGTTVSLELPGGGALPAGIPIAAMIGDSHASLYGLGGFRPGSVKATYGTGTSLMTPMADVVGSEHGLSTTVAWGRERSGAVYALEGNIYATGGAVQWVGELLGLADPGPDVERLARGVPDAGGVIFVPALVGLGAPHWAESAQGLITGLTLGVGAPQLARAALDAIAYQVRDVFDVMQAEAGAALTTLLADGGASRNDLLMQLQADVLGCAVERSRSSEVSPLGAAFLAGLTIGLWSDEAAVAALVPPRDRFEPGADADVGEAAYARWQAAVGMAVGR
jgi:glycerol kinase